MKIFFTFLYLENAELVGGSDLEDVVLAVPVNFSEEQRLSLWYKSILFSHFMEWMMIFVLDVL